MTAPASSVAHMIHETQAGLADQRPLPALMRTFFCRAQEENWSDFQLGWAIQVVWMGAAPIHGGSLALTEDAILDLVTEVELALPRHRHEQVEDIVTDLIPKTKVVEVERQGQIQRIAMADFEAVLRRTAMLDARTEVLNRWGRALNHYFNANAMARGCLVGRVLDLHFLMRETPMALVEGYTLATHDRLVLEKLTPSDQAEARDLLAATFKRQVTLSGPTLGQALGVVAPTAASISPTVPSRPTP